MFKFSNVCRGPERFKTQLLRDAAGKAPSYTKPHRLSAVALKKLGFLGTPDTLSWHRGAVFLNLLHLASQVLEPTL